MTWMGYEECRDRMHHMKMCNGLTPEESAMGCTISDVWSFPKDAVVIELEEEE